jgi:glycosyltransferase involved in cell wall biosynthesis
MPKVSVIIPTYNGEKLIGRAISSVLNQTFKDIEIIVVDDASTDNTKRVIKDLSARDNRIRLIDLQQNSGGGAYPRTIGCKMAIGEFVAFIDQDDLYIPDYIAKKVEYFDEHKEINFLSSLAWTFNEESKKIINCEYGGPLNTMVRRDVLENVGYFRAEQTNVDDFGMWYRYLVKYGQSKNKSVSHCPLTLYSRHPSQGSYVENKDPLIFVKRIESLIKEIEGGRRDSLTKGMLGYLFSRQANFYCMARDFKQGRRLFLKSLKNKFNLMSLILLIFSLCPPFYNEFRLLLKFFRQNILWKSSVCFKKLKCSDSYMMANKILESL